MPAEPSQPASALQAEAEVAIPNPAHTIEKVFEHLAGHDLDIRRIADGAAASLLYGTASMHALADGVLMRARAEDEAGLAYIKGMMASHLIEFAEGPRPQIVWTGDGVDATTFPNFREMRVVRIADITPHMRRVTLSGHGLERFATHGLHFKLFVPPAGVSEPEWPVPGKDGLPIWPSDDKRPKIRTYTVRSIDPGAGTFDVDFVMHGDRSVGSRWAMHATPGDIVGVRGPVGRPVPDADWYLLAGDETALPAIARTLESLPAGKAGVALIEVADESETQPIRHDTGIEVRWLFRNGAEPGTTTQLADAVRAVPMPAAGTRIHAMAGVEFDTFKAIRRYWRDELGLDKKDVLATAYWRRGKAEGEPAED